MSTVRGAEIDGGNVVTNVALFDTTVPAPYIECGPEVSKGWTYVDPDFFPPVEVVDVEALREQTIDEIATEAARRSSFQVEAMDSIEMLKLYEELWPMLNQGQASAEMIMVKDIAIYGKSAAQFAKTATEQQLLDYNAATDPNWPDNP